LQKIYKIILNLYCCYQCYC